MKVAAINYSDIDGGAARAAYRIHHALRQHGADSSMWVCRASSGCWTVRQIKVGGRQALITLRVKAAALVTGLLETGNSTIHSPAALPSRLHRDLNSSDLDVVHLHWVNFEMMSVGDIGRLRKPIVWTLHDMWAFCGAEHYTEDFRWRDGYTHKNRPSYEKGFDLNYWTWRRKREAWQRPMQLVAPSHWLAECARQSVLMRDWSIHVIHNAIDTERWSPIDKTVARSLLGLPADTPLLLFGAIGGSIDPRKGFDLLSSALDHLRGELKGLELVVFGQLPPKEPTNFGFPVHYTGHMFDDISLRLLYSAADALVIPSRQDNLPNTGVEALACGTPVVAFNTCGLPDIVIHKQTGYLAQAYDTTDMAAGIRWVLSDRSRHFGLCVEARRDAVMRFSYPVVARQYLEVYGLAQASQRQ